MRLSIISFKTVEAWLKRRACGVIWMAVWVVTVSLAGWIQLSEAAKPCDRVVSYFLFPYQGSRLTQDEWRVFDPSRGTDTIFLSLPGGFQQVRWDTTFQNVYFSSGDSLYSSPWRLGAKPRLITRLPTRLPAEYEHWWLDPDTGSWLSLHVSAWWTTNDPYVSRFEGKLWESTPDGGPWRLVRADSVDLVDEDDDLYQWSDGTPVPRGAPAVTLNDLASKAWEKGWSERQALFDTATVTLNKGDITDPDQWFFLGLQSSPRRGIAFRSSGPLEPEHTWTGVLGPLYFVDLDRRTKSLVYGEEGIMRSLVAEHCGYLLIPGVAQKPLVIDSSGRQVFSPPWNSNGAVWVPRPRE